MKRLFLLGAVAATLVGCREGAGRATALTIEVPTRAAAGEAFTAVLTVKDAQGRVARTFDAAVTFYADGAPNLPRDAAFTPASNGRLAVPLRLLASGSHGIIAQAGGLRATSAPIEIAPGPPAALTITGGDHQSGVVGSLLPQPLAVTVRDAFGNSVGAGTTVYFAATSGGAVAAGEVATDAAGSASTMATLGAVAGVQHFTARLGSGAEVELAANAVASVALEVRVVSGDQQVAPPGAQLPAPLVAQVVDASGNAVSGATVLWTATGFAQLSPVRSVSDANGLVQTVARLSSAPVNVTLSATLGASIALFHAAPTGLSYGDPPAGQGPVRLELVGPGSVAGSLTLRLVAAQPLSGFTVGFDLPLHGAPLALIDFTPGTALPPGSNPIAARGLIPTSGPLAGQLVTAQSQKRSGAGAVPGDAAIAAGSVFYTLTLVPGATATPGVIFDGASVDSRVQAGLLSLAGTEVVGPTGFALGRLELH